MSDSGDFHSWGSHEDGEVWEFRILPTCVSHSKAKQIIYHPNVVPKIPVQLEITAFRKALFNPARELTTFSSCFAVFAASINRQFT